MLRTNNKRLHSNLWTLAHFIGSALVFLLLVGSCVYLEFHHAGGAQTTGVISTSKFVADYDTLDVLFDRTSSDGWFLPISSLFNTLVPLAYYDGGFGGILLYVVAVGLDFVLWFNIALWFLQLLVFIPDVCFHWLERKKED